MEHYNLFSTGNTAGQVTGQSSAVNNSWLIAPLFVIDSFLDVYCLGFLTAAAAGCFTNFIAPQCDSELHSVLYFTVQYAMLPGSAMQPDVLVIDSCKHQWQLSCICSIRGLFLF